jgi:TRAP transporter TAXI family solute receptor
MTKRDVLRYIALGSALLTVVASAWYLLFVPYTLRMAVAPAGGEPAQFLSALAGMLDRQKAPVRLTVLTFPDNRLAAAAIDAGKADLAVVRSDLSLPTSGLGVAILNQLMVVIAARPDLNIVHFSDLRGRKVGVLAQGAGNRTLFDQIAAFYGLPLEAITIVSLTSLDDISKATTSRQIDAVFIVAPRGEQGGIRAAQAFQDALGSTPVTIAIEEAAALARRNPIFTAAQIAPGEIRASPQIPAAASATVTFPTLIVAHRSLKSKAVYEFTQQLFNLRQTLAGDHQAAAHIEALPTERGSPFSVHPGAVTYYDASETGFLENYSDYLWLGLFGFGTIISLATWLFSLAFPKKRELVLSEHTELVTLMDAARAASTLTEIDNIERRVDQIVAQTSQLIFDGTIDSEQQPAFDLLLARLATILETRRSELGETTHLSKQS